VGTRKKTKDGADRRKDEGFDTVDWYFSKKKI
jgi:hypothetical protein